MMLVKTSVGPSAIHGLGLFTAQFIPRGTPVWRFLQGFDQDFTPNQFDALPLLAREHTRFYCFVSYMNHHVILSGDHARFINHSLTPNSGAPPDASPPVTTVALHYIATSDEIT